jgi:hypothetical protein
MKTATKKLKSPYLWLALALLALSACTAYVTPQSDEDDSLKEMRRKYL